MAFSYVIYILENVDPVFYYYPQAFPWSGATYLLAGLEIATDTVANVTNIFSLTTKNSGLVAT